MTATGILILIIGLSMSAGIGIGGGIGSASARREARESCLARAEAAQIEQAAAVKLCGKARRLQTAPSSTARKARRARRV